LSLALCIDALDGDVPRAQRVYQQVKWMVVAAFDQHEWRITQDEILATIEGIEEDITATTATCPFHGTEYDARLGGCPICIADERETGTWER